MVYTLSNSERKHLGLDPIEERWDFVDFPADKYRQQSILVFDGEIIKRHIISTENSYIEKQYNDLTKNRSILLPKTNRGKEKKLTPATFERLNPQGVYFNFSQNKVQIASYATLTTFYSTRMEPIKIESIEQFKAWLNQYIRESTVTNIKEITEFKSRKRKNIRCKSGDVFAFKIDRNNYGYGQVVEDIDNLRKSLPDSHGFNYLMGKPLLVRLFHHVTKGIEHNVKELSTKKTTPSQYIFDNHIFYGEYPIIGNATIPHYEVDFPISYGKVLYASPEIYFQWGRIHMQKPLSEFNKHLKKVNDSSSKDSPNHEINNPYSNIGIGWQLLIDKKTLMVCIKMNSNEPYWNQKIYKLNNDLRNPKNKTIKTEILGEFGLDSNLDYSENK